MSKNLPIVLIIVVFIIVAFAGVFYLSFRSALSDVSNTVQTVKPADTSTKALKKIHVPAPNEPNINPDIAVPKIAKDTLPGQITKVREFDIRAENNEFQPSKIIVYENDVVSITLFPADKAYDISFPDFSIQSPVKAKENISVQFQATRSGVFPFLCNSCGSQARGSLTVVPR